MLARELVSEIIPPLKTSDTGSKALVWMNEFHVTHLPIVNNQEFLGLISEEDILDMNDPDQPMGNHKLSLVRPMIHENQHIFEVIKLAANLKLSIIPVVDKDEKFVGIITPENLVTFLSQISAISEPGSIIVLEISKRDYSLSEIARLVESDDAKVLSLYVTSHHDSTKMELTMKLNIPDLKHVVATFERFGYIVKASYQESEHFDDLKQNYNSLMKYLNI